MTDLFTQLKQLNIIHGAYENWSHYREKLTDFVLANSSAGDTLLIFGAGECNDFDLKKLTAFFSDVTLLDIDSEAVSRGLIRQNIKKNRVNVVAGDIVGIPEERYRDFGNNVTEALRTGKTVSAETFTKEMRTAFSERVPCLFPKADTVVCCGVHSQLLSVYPRIAAVVSGYRRLDMNEVLKTSFELNTILAAEVNEKLFHAARKVLITGIEEKRIGIDGGVEGAAQALADFETRKKPDDEIRLVWPFSLLENKQYEMLVRSYKNVNIRG